MWKTQVAAYLRQESEEGFLGYIASSLDSQEKINFFLVFDIEEGITKDQGREILALIKRDLLNQQISNLSGFENFITDQIKKYNLPAGLSLAAGFLANNIFYLRTINQGAIFVRRQNKLTKIIEGENIASGFVEKDDFFILTTKRFINLFGENHLAEILNQKTPTQLMESLAPEMEVAADQKAVALFLQFSEVDEIEDFPEKEPPQQKWPIFQAVGEKKRTLTIGLVILLSFILFWSVGLGVSRRQEKFTTEKIKKSRELIVQKLDQAEEVAFLNLPRAQTLIDEAKTTLADLKKDIGDKRKEVVEINSLIKEKENKILKKEEKNYQEFYDLTIDQKKAAGTKLYLNDDILTILDKDQGIIYLFSLTKKSLEKVVHSQIKSASLIAYYQEKVFFFVADKGVYKIDKNNTAQVVIKPDKEWGEIGDLAIYNGNIYLLDKGKNKIYKYLAGEEEFSNKIDYLKPGESLVLKEATSLAIDSSLYIGFPNYTAKFTAGVRDSFKTSFPNENFYLNKVITSKDLNKVYNWDKKNAAIYVLGKNGTYEREVRSAIFSRGSDVVVYDKAAYILMKEKIYEVNLD